MQNQQFRGDNMLADELVRSVEDVSNEDLIEILPETLPEPEMDPRDERAEHLRALRWIVTNDRLVEALSTLLTSRARAVQLCQRRWGLDRTDDDRWAIEYRWIDVTEDVPEDHCEPPDDMATADWPSLQGGEPRNLRILVNAEDGSMEPDSDIADLALRSLTIQRLDTGEDEEAAAPEGSGEGAPEGSGGSSGGGNP